MTGLKNWVQLVAVMVVCQFRYARSQTNMRIVDLTHEMNSDTLYWPGNPAYNFTELARGPVDPPGFWLVN